MQTEADDAAEAADGSPDEVPSPTFPAEDQLLRHEAPSPTSSEDSQTVAQGKNPNLSVEDVSGRRFFYSFPNTPNSRSLKLPHQSTSGITTEFEDDDEPLDEDSEGEFPPGRRPRTAPTSSRWQSRTRRVQHRLSKAWKTFGEFMTVPLWAALASLVVACIQPLQHGLDKHLPPVKNAIAGMGDCSIPITLVVLGAYFYTPPEAEDKQRSRGTLPEHHEVQRSASRTSSRTTLFENVREMFSGKALKGKASDRTLVASASREKRPGETKTVVVAILSRMIITPILLLPLMTLSTVFDLQRVFDECVFTSLLLLCSC